MTDPLLHTWSLNLGYAQRLVADIPDDKMARQPDWYCEAGLLVYTAA